MLMVTSCDSPEQKYEKGQIEAEEAYHEDLQRAKSDYERAKRKEARKHIDESERPRATP